MGVRGLVKQGLSGLLTDGLDPKGLAASIETLLGDPQLCAEMGGAAQEIVRSDYSEEIIGTRLYNLLHESLGLDPAEAEKLAAVTPPDLGPPVQL
ncbi:hypothetical protein D3C85_1500260 [compost metagenome]